MKIAPVTTTFVGLYARAAMPARYALERGAWQDAAGLQPVGSTYPFVEAITYFARSIGAARSGNLASAREGADALESSHKKLLAARNSYWATEVETSDSPPPGGSHSAKETLRRL